MALVALPLASALVTSVTLRGASTLSSPKLAAPTMRRHRGGIRQMRMTDVSAALELATAALAAGTTFEAQAPPIGTSLAVLGSTAGVIAYWWLVLVPSERRDLAKNKNKVCVCLCVSGHACMYGV